MSRSPTARCIAFSGIATPTHGSSMRSLTENLYHGGHGEDRGHGDQRPCSPLSARNRRVLRGSDLSYIELHTASAFSFLQGASLPEALVDRAADLGYPAVALLDRDGVYGAPRFHKAAIAAGLRPIIGAELTIAAEAGRQEGRQGRTVRPRSTSPSRLPAFALARSLRKPGGLSNLCRLITRMKLRAPKGEGALTLEDLDGSTRGLVALVGRAALRDRTNAGAPASAA